MDFKLIILFKIAIIVSSQYPPQNTNPRFQSNRETYEYYSSSNNPNNPGQFYGYSNGVPPNVQPAPIPPNGLNYPQASSNLGNVNGNPNYPQASPNLGNVNVNPNYLQGVPSNLGNNYQGNYGSYPVNNQQGNPLSQGMNDLMNLFSSILGMFLGGFQQQQG